MPSHDRPSDGELPGDKSTNTEPIKAFRARRWTLLALTSIFRKLNHAFNDYPSVFVLIPGRLCLKDKDDTDLAEASAMQFIANHTSIPVPKVYSAFFHRGRGYIFMEHIRGDMLANTWGLKGEGSKARLLSQLRDYVKQMRMITPPHSGVSNVDGGSFYDGRLPGATPRLGPFQSIQSFHEYLRNGTEPHTDSKSLNALISWQQKKDWPAPVFTHGDLSSLNILAEGDKITGIVDWETAGWFPYYWEYTSALTPNIYNFFFHDEVDKFLDPFPEELKMERIRQQYFTPFSMDPMRE